MYKFQKCVIAFFFARALSLSDRQIDRESEAISFENRMSFRSSSTHTQNDTSVVWRVPNFVFRIQIHRATTKMLLLNYCARFFYQQIKQWRFKYVGVFVRNVALIPKLNQSISNASIFRSFAQRIAKKNRLACCCLMCWLNEMSIS